MAKSKKFLSAVLAILMALSTMSCLSSVVAFADATATGYEHVGNNWDKAFSTTDNWDGIDSLAELRQKYGTWSMSNPWMYIGIEVYEQDEDGEFTVLTDHKVSPGQELLLRYYVKGDCYAGDAATLHTQFDRTFFDISYTTNPYYLGGIANLNDGLPDKGFVSNVADITTLGGSINSDSPYACNFSGVTTTMNPAMSVQAYKPKTGTNYSASTGVDVNQAKYWDIMTSTMKTGTEITKVMDIASDEYVFDIPVKVRTTDTQLFGTVNTDPDYSYRGVDVGAIGHLGVEEYVYVWHNGTPCPAYISYTDNADTGKLKATKAAKNNESYLHTEDCNHTFIIEGEGEDEGFTATFKSQGETVTTLTGTEITAPAAPAAPAGKEFAGWTDGVNTYGAGATITLTQDSEFAAVWNDVFTGYNVKFFDGDNEYTSLAMTGVSGAVTLPAAQTKAGYRFIGWNDGSSVLDAGTSYNVIANKNFTAEWLKLYTATFTGDGISTTTAQYAAGETVTFPETGSRQGYTPVWTPSSNVMPAADTTYTLSWVGDEVSITFNSNGGSSVAAITAEAGSAISAPAAPTKEGYTFGGWYVNPDFSGSAYTFSTMPTSALTLNAKWVAIPHTVTYVNADGTVLQAAQTADYAAAIPVYNGAEPAKTGYTFNGWKDADGNTLASYNGVMPNKDLVFTAQFDANQYTITFKKLNGEVVKTGTQTYGNALDIPAAPVEAGKTFAGWTGDDSSFIADGATASVPAGNVTYTATYDTNTYTVQYKLDGVNYGEPVSYTYGATISDPTVPDSAIPTGKQFDGWESHAATVTDNMIINGTTSWINYTITYKVNGETYKTFTNQHYGDGFPVPADPTLAGYSFEGWSDEPLTVTGNAEINAIFNALTYDVTFVYGLEGEYEEQDSVTYGESIEVFPDEDAAIAGYGLTWKFGDNTITAPWAVPALPAGTEIVIIANYGAETHSVIFRIKRANGNYDVINTVSGEVGTNTNAVSYVIPDSAKITGYDYSAWDKEIPAVFGATDVVITATETAHVYTDTWYDIDGETVLYTADVAFGSDIPTFDVPVHAGIENIRWSGLGDGKQQAKDMIFTATGTAGQVNYTAVFKTEQLDGSYISESKTRQGATGDIAAFAASDLIMAGYDYDATAADSVPTAVISGDGTTEIVAVFNLKRYTLTISDEGYTGTEPNTITLKHGEAIPDPEAAGKTGYSFNNYTWSRTAGGASIGKPSEATQNLFVTINYKVNVWKLIPVVNGEEGTAVDVAYGSALTELAPATETGYTFAGWYSDSGCDTAFDWTQTMPDNDVYAYGTLTAITYTYTFISNGTSQQVSGTIGETISAPAAADKTGYTFKRWTPSVPATFGPEADLEFNAYYEVNNYKLNYVADGATVKSYDVPYGTAKADIEASYKPADPTKTGYTFTGWIGIPDTMGAEAVDVIAEFTVNTYDAVFYQKKGSTEVAATVAGVAFGETFKAPAALEDTELEKFGGWVAADGTVYAAGDDIAMNAEGLSFYAKWDQDTTACHVDTAARVSEGYYQRGPADYQIVLKDGVSANSIVIKYTSESGQKITNTFTKASIILDNEEGYSITNIGGVGGAETWNLNLSLAEGDAYKIYVNGKVGDSEFQDDDDTAFIMAVAYDTKTEEVVAEEFISAALSETSILRGNEATWTVTTSTDVTWLEFVGKYTSEAGEDKVLTTYYKASNYMDAETGITVSDSNGVRTWVIPMKFTYTVSDARITENWTISYKVNGSSVFDKGVDYESPVTVARTAQALAPATESYDKFDLISVDANVTEAKVGDKITFTIVTTDDVSKVRIGFAYTLDGANKTKTATYQETSSNVTNFEKANGLITWTISYKVPTQAANAIGDLDFNVECRGLEWGETVSENITITA